MGGSSSRAYTKIGSSLATAPLHEFQTGDVVLYKYDIWLVKSYDGRGVTIDKVSWLRKLTTVPTCELELVLVAPPHDDYEEWFTAFSAMTGHYTNVLDNRKLIQDEILADDYLRVQQINIKNANCRFDDYNSDLIRIEMKAAGNIIRRIPHSILLTRCEDKYEHVDTNTNTNTNTSTSTSTNTHNCFLI